MQNVPPGVQVLPGSALEQLGAATNQATNEFDIAIDNNHDGTTDYYVVGADLGEATAGEFNGILASFTIDAASNSVVDGWIADAPMNGSVVELPVVASEIGVTSNTPDFTYSVAGFTPLDTSLADPTTSASFDAFRPPVDSGQFASLASGETAGLPLTLDVGRARATKTRGWLVVSVDDASGVAQADEVPVPKNLGPGKGGKH